MRGGAGLALNSSSTPSVNLWSTQLLGDAPSPGGFCGCAWLGLPLRERLGEASLFSQLALESSPALQVKVLLGEDREGTGTLLSIDGEDGIVRMNPERTIRILNLRFLGKLVAA